MHPPARRRAAKGAGHSAGAAHAGGGAGEVRIIGGEWRRRRLGVPAVEGLRPTPDRVRETLFNWLGQRLDGQRCLDLFAGSGALGLEAASRGAASVTLVDADPRVERHLLAQCAALGGGDRVRVLQGDALHFLRDTEPLPAYDLVFLDPPYALGLLPSCLDAVPRLLAPGARVYLEDTAPLPVPAGWELFRAGRGGRVHFGLLTCKRHVSGSSTPAPSTP